MVELGHYKLNVIFMELDNRGIVVFGNSEVKHELVPESHGELVK